MEHELLERRSATPTSSSTTSAPAVSPGGAAGRLLAMQRTAGNAAVASLVGARTVPGAPVSAAQRQGLDDVFAPGPFGGGHEPQASGDGGGPTSEPAGGINELGPVARTGTLIADAVIASSYTPGAGNIW